MVGSIGLGNRLALGLIPRAGRGASFDPSSLFAANEDGAFYDPSALTSLYQSRTGRDNSGVGDVVGLMLDKRLMGGLTASAFISAQPDKLTTTNTPEGGWTYDTGTQTVTASGTAGTDRVSITLDATLTADVWYEVAIPNTMPAGAFFVDFGSGATQVGGLASTDDNVIIKATAGTETQVRIGRWSGSPTGTVGPITFKEIPGNHAVAPSDAARPILQATALDTAATTGGDIALDWTASEWAPSGTNTVVDNGDQVDITYVDTPTGATLTNIAASTVNVLYKVTYQAKVNAGSFLVRLGAGSDVQDFTISNTTFETFTAIYMGTGGSIYIQSRNMTTGEILSIKDIVVEAVAAADYLYYLEPDGVDDWMPTSPLADLGETWSHVGGWEASSGSTGAFATSEDYRGAVRASGSVWDWYNSGGGVTAISTTDPDSASQVLTIEQASTTSLVARINGVEEVSAITPYNDSALVQGLALFSLENDGYSSGWDGKFFGGVWIDRAFVDDERASLEAFQAAKSGVTI